MNLYTRQIRFRISFSLGQMVSLIKSDFGIFVEMKRVCTIFSVIRSIQIFQLTFEYCVDQMKNQLADVWPLNSSPCQYKYDTTLWPRHQSTIWSSLQHSWSVWPSSYSCWSSVTVMILTELSSRKKRRRRKKRSLPTSRVIMTELSIKRIKRRWRSPHTVPPIIPHLHTIQAIQHGFKF